jgi:hypothetical protein
VAGSAHLEGFDPSGPLAALEGLRLGLGLTADQIYFSVEHSAPPIPLPSFGRYDGGSVDPSSFRIGYGYTRNSLAMSFAGALVLPPQLIEDVDTSDLIGSGVRLPHHTAVGFRLDLIPVTLGPVDLVVPLIEFDVDLRSPSLPALASGDGCVPNWDGLQVVVPGIYHDAFRRLAFAPMFGPLPTPNVRFDGALMIGDERNGVTIVADNVLVLLGVLSTSSGFIPIPLLASLYEPYFDHVCLNVRVAGFEVNVDLQRPFRSLSPLALFEILGLLERSLVNFTGTAAIRRSEPPTSPPLARRRVENGATGGRSTAGAPRSLGSHDLDA